MIETEDPSVQVDPTTTQTTAAGVPTPRESEEEIVHESRSLWSRISDTSRTRIEAFMQAPDAERLPWWKRHPESIADLIAYTKAGGWVPGDKHPWIERIGMAYGWGVAIPGNITLRAVAWILARPSRLATVLIAGTAVRFTITGKAV